MQVDSVTRARGWRLGVGLVAMVLGGIASGQSAAPSDGTAERMVAEYVQAWNAGDVEALGRMWTADGELIDAHGDAVDRKALLAAKLASGKGPRPVLSITLEKVRLVDPNVALIDGESRLASPEGSVLQQTRFSGALVQQGGAWRIRLIRQLSSRQLSSRQPPPAEPLKELGWLVGDWVGLGNGLRVQISTQWDLGGRSLVSRFAYEPENGDPYEAEVRAGWDPQTRSIKSWYFDSRGVISTSSWERNGDHWLAAVTGMQPDGENFTGTMAITRIDNDSYLRTMSGVEVGGKNVPDQELRIFRVPEQPTE